MAQDISRSPTAADRQQIQQIIDRHLEERPEGVHRVEFAFGEDWTGYPAVYVNLFVDKELKPTEAKVRELNDYVKLLHDEIIDNEIGFWPYSRTFEE
jgi:hypothetical protein